MTEAHEDPELEGFLASELESARDLEPLAQGADDLSALAQDLVALRRRVAPELEAAPDWSPIREARLVARILAHTTRQDLSWRGELRLVGQFIRERLVQSPALRAVAAMLVLQLLAFPLVLSKGLRQNLVKLFFEPPVEMSIDFDVPPEIPLELPAEAPLEPGVFQGGVTQADLIEGALRRARFVLSTAPPAALSDEPGAAAPLEERLLAARVRYLREGLWDPRMDTRLPPEASPLARVLWAELLLDRLALSGQHSAALGALLNGLALDAAAAAQGPRELGAAGLRALVLDRARAYGAWEAEPDFRPDRVDLPFSASWRAALTRAAAAADLADSVVLAAWTRSR